jgi:hypothetical protein
MPPVSLRREVGRLVKKWRKHLGIGDQWRIEVRIKEKPGDDDGDDAQAHIVVTPQYFHATMVLNAWQCEGVNLEEVVCHEMLHVVMKPIETIVESAMGERFAELGEQHLESVVERLSRCLVRLASA